VCDHQAIPIDADQLNKHCPLRQVLQYSWQHGKRHVIFPILLRQWISPYDDAPPVNHLGIDRINFYVDGLTAVVETMNSLGFQQLGPIGGSPEIGIVYFFDPDGIKVQFAGPQKG